MNKLTILAVLLLLVFQNVTIAQSDICVQNSNLKREKFRLAFDTPNSSVLKKEQLYSMFSYSQYEDYNLARRCYFASIPLFSLAAYATGFGVVISNIGFFDPIIILICGVPALALAISGTILIIYSAKKLNQIAENYNNQRYTSHYQRNIQLNFGFTQNGIGFNLSF